MRQTVRALGNVTLLERPDATLYAVLDAGYRPHEIEVTSLGLEQAFLAITAEDDRANGADHNTADHSTADHSTGETI